MADGRTDIANLALNHVGEPPIMDLDDDNHPTARIVKLIFNPTIREVGRDHVWNCLKKRDIAAKLVLAPIFGYANQFQLPTDFLRLVELNGSDVNERKIDYEIEAGPAGGRVLLSDAEEAKIQYIHFTEDTTIFDSLFTEALAILMASKIATQIRQDAKGVELLQRYKQSALPGARKVDSNERRRRPHDNRERSRSLSSRITGTFQGSINP